LRAPYVDVDGDGFCSPVDALIVIDWLNLQPADRGGEAEGEAADDYFRQLGSGTDPGEDLLAMWLFHDSNPLKKNTSVFPS
jgi:hypothetical protein